MSAPVPAREQADVEALAAILKALSELSAESRKRVLYAAQAFYRVDR